MKRRIIGLSLIFLFITAIAGAEVARTLNYGQVSVANTATVILAANIRRTSILVKNDGSADIYVGGDSSVTTSNGLIISPGEGVSFPEYYGAIHGIVASGAETASYLEESN
jgi:quinol-cytochrome oxidoreductase complex cytochrome b subunit|tara:strand:- start:6128 stop:6460 length:333 start_codon:yes stop_codon:yes gene_type:complete